MARELQNLLLMAVVEGFWFLIFMARQAHAFSYSYPGDLSSDILLLGDAVERQGAVELTRASYSEDVSSKSVGRALCRTPIRMTNPRTGHMASFTTSFSFQMHTINHSFHGDGLAFLIVPDNNTLGGYGEQLGAFTSLTMPSADQHTFAVEFDTWQNINIHDPNDNHVGVDVANASSIVYNNASNAGIQLNGGSIITAWVQYDGILHSLKVRMSADNIEPIEPLMDVNISLESFVNEFMYVGFSASTGQGSYEAHSLLAWTFSSWGLEDELSKTIPSDKHKDVMVLIVCIFLSSAVLCFGTLLWWVGVCKGGYANKFYRARDYYHHSKLASHMLCPRPFSYKELHVATEGFGARARMLRGHTSVESSFYKGVLADSGQVVAVKQLARDPQEGLQEFLGEVSAISNLRHRNLVPLQGWCLEKGDLMLVYECMPNDSLDNFIFNASNREPLGWAQRYDIVCGIAAGLKCLHEGLVDQKRGHHAILHRNVKCSNVMLDNNFTARLGDYGLGRLVCRHRRTMDVLEGTFGYVAPEVVENGKMSTMGDVYSFGVVVLEVACGKRQLEQDQVLSDMVWGLERHGKLLEAADARLKGCFDVKEMECLLQVGLLCSLADPLQRPSMSLVHSILQGEAPLPQLLISPRPSQSISVSFGNPDTQDTLSISIDMLLSDKL